MTVFDFTKEKEGVWFDMEDGGRVQLKTLKPIDWIEIRKATIEKIPFIKKIEKKYQLFEREVTDEDLQMQMIYDITIIAWEKLFDGEEKPIPCTKENKTSLMLMQDPRFRDFVNEKISILGGIETEQKETSEKN